MLADKLILSCEGKQTNMGFKNDDRELKIFYNYTEPKATMLP